MLLSRSTSSVARAAQAPQVGAGSAGRKCSHPGYQPGRWRASGGVVGIHSCTPTDLLRPWLRLPLACTAATILPVQSATRCPQARPAPRAPHARCVRVRAHGAVGATELKKQGFIGEMRAVAMKLHTREQAPKEGKQESKQPMSAVSLVGARARARSPSRVCVCARAYPAAPRPTVDPHARGLRALPGGERGGVRGL
jgi:hypothetical protein